MARYALGIESTAHTLGIAVVGFDGTILANEMAHYKPRSANWGIVPMESAKNMEAQFDAVLKRALEKAKIREKEIDLIAFARGPGMGPCLRVAATNAKALSEKWKVPAVDVNHIVAHVEIAKLKFGHKDPLVVVVSGGTTQLVKCIQGRYRVIGETLDIAIGNAFDKLARELKVGDGKLPWAGHLVDARAKKGKKYVPLTYGVKGMDLCFSGMVTQAARLLEKESVEDLCFSFQETAMSMIAEVTERALSYTGARELLLTGGSARNARLQDMLNAMCARHDFAFGVAEGEYNQDNGAMIAWAGVVKHQANPNVVPNFEPDQHWRIDEEDANWVPATTEKKHADTRFWGAEALIEITGDTVVKTRVRKEYRIREIDDRLVKTRTRAEARLLERARAAGVAVPKVVRADEKAGVIEMERVIGPTAKAFLDDEKKTLLEKKKAVFALGRAVAKMHDAGMVHGDLSTKNVIMGKRGVALIDFGLAKMTERAEDLATDLLLLQNVLCATYPDTGEALWHEVLHGYGHKDRPHVRGMMDAARVRGRHKLRPAKKPKKSDGAQIKGKRPA